MDYLLVKSTQVRQYFHFAPQKVVVFLYLIVLKPCYKFILAFVRCEINVQSNSELFLSLDKLYLIPKVIPLKCILSSQIWIGVETWKCFICKFKSTLYIVTHHEIVVVGVKILWMFSYKRLAGFNASLF